MLAIILSLFLSTCLSHQLKAGSWPIPCTTANWAVCTGWDSFDLDNFSHVAANLPTCSGLMSCWSAPYCSLLLTRKWPCYPYHNQLAHLGVNTHSHFHCIGHTLTKQYKIVWIHGKWVKASSKTGEHAFVEGQLAKQMLEVLHTMEIHAMAQWWKYMAKNMIFLIDCDMRGFDENAEVNQWDNHNS